MLANISIEPEHVEEIIPLPASCEPQCSTVILVDVPFMSHLPAAFSPLQLWSHAITSAYLPILPLLPAHSANAFGAAQNVDIAALSVVQETPPLPDSATFLSLASTRHE